jgi:uncharacterized protein YceK
LDNAVESLRLAASGGCTSMIATLTLSENDYQVDDKNNSQTSNNELRRKTVKQLLNVDFPNACVLRGFL